MSKISSHLSYFNLTLTTKFILILFIFNGLLINKAIAQEKFKIVIDAGHGGKDPGRPNPNGILEKNIVLNIALNLSKNLNIDLKSAKYSKKLMLSAVNSGEQNKDSSIINKIIQKNNK